MHIGDRLNALPDNATRARACLRLAEQARNAYQDGKAREVEAVIYSGAHQFDAFGTRERKLIGERRWAASKRAQDLAGDEQMFSRWAQMYALMAAVELREAAA